VGVWRKWVFPILRLLVLAAIAVALVKVAFFADPPPTDGPAVPTGSITDPQVTATLGTIVNDVSLDGTVSADAAVAVRATGAGTVDEIFLPQGTTVAVGDKIFDIKVETPQDPVESTDAMGVVTVSQPKPIISYAKVFAPAAGVLSSLTVLHGQAVAIGDAAGQVAPPTFSVSGTLSPEQQYRLLDKPTEATVTITGGPAPFTCTGLTITTPLAGEGTGTQGDGTGGSTGATVRCAVPPEVTVFSGLAATITIPAGSAENVLVIPTTAVDGGSQTGVVYAVADDGSTEQRDVVLGLTDGTMVQVISGLDEGQPILQFTPSAIAPVDVGGGCFDDGTGNITCSDPGLIAK
jgi:hypothetical protein